MKESKWTIKTWVTAILVLIGIGTTWAVSIIGGDKTPESIFYTPCSSAMVIFEQKKRCGFIDLGKQVVVVGRVGTTRVHTDGDQSVNIYPDPGYEWLLYYEGRKTRNYLHVEFMPCERSYKDIKEVLLKVEKRLSKDEKVRVKVTGRWAYDGVDHRGQWRDQLGRCLGGREPDVELGWTEIHPAYHIEIINKVVTRETK